MVYHSNYLPSGNQYYKRTKERKTTAKNTSPSRLSPYTSLTQIDKSATTTEHFDPSGKHINTKHFIIHTCLMMEEVSLETLPTKQQDLRHDKLR